MTTNDMTGQPDPRTGQVTRRRALQLSGGAVMGTAAAAILGTAGQPAGTGGPPGAPALRLASGSTQLLITEPSPDWWTTTSIWVVPGSDPNGWPGTPVAGEPAYIWVRIHNVSDVQVTDVQVRFYWANPALEMRFSMINPIGTAHATIAAHGSQDVLCLVPWEVEFVNGGHECLVVAASLPGDPQLPDLVDPPGCPQVAQRNVTVWETAPKGLDRLKLDLIAPPEQPRSMRLSSQLGGSAAPELLAQLRLGGARPVREPAVQVGFSLRPDTDQVGDAEIIVDVPAGGTVPVYVNVRRTGPILAREYQLVTVSGHQGSQLLGGVSFLVTGQE